MFRTMRNLDSMDQDQGRSQCPSLPSVQIRQDRARMCSLTCSGPYPNLLQAALKAATVASVSGGLSHRILHRVSRANARQPGKAYWGE